MGSWEGRDFTLGIAGIFLGAAPLDAFFLGEGFGVAGAIGTGGIGIVALEALALVTLATTALSIPLVDAEATLFALGRIFLAGRSKIMSSRDMILEKSVEVRRWQWAIKAAMQNPFTSDY